MYELQPVCWEPSSSGNSRPAPLSPDVQPRSLLEAAGYHPSRRGGPHVRPGPQPPVPCGFLPRLSSCAPPRARRYLQPPLRSGAARLLPTRPDWPQSPGSGAGHHHPHSRRVHGGFLRTTLRLPCATPVTRPSPGLPARGRVARTTSPSKRCSPRRPPAGSAGPGALPAAAWGRGCAGFSAPGQPGARRAGRGARR